METEEDSSYTAIVKDQLRSSGAAFSVKYIGFIEVATPFHDVKGLGEKRIALCNGCASLIAQAAELIPKKPIDPEIQKLIGENEPKFFKKEIELTITNKVITLFNTDDRKLLKKVEIANISIAVTVGDTLNNGFVFIGKVKTKTNELKRFCFLFKSEEDPKNIYFAIDVAFNMLAANNNNGTSAPNPSSPKNDGEIFKKPYPPGPPLPEKGAFSYLNVGGKDHQILLNQKIGKPRPHLDADFKSYPGPCPDVTPVEKFYKSADGARIFRQPVIKKKDGIKNATQGDLYRKSPGSPASLYSNIFGDDLAATSTFANIPFSHSICTAERFEKICCDIEKLPYFFGHITRQSAEDNYLKLDGSYLIRYSDSQALTAILSVRQGKTVHHILLNDKNGNVTSDNSYYNSIYHLMAIHTRENLPFTTEGSNAVKVYIKHPAVRPKFGEFSKSH